jgi:hypothetical protein
MNDTSRPRLFFDEVIGKKDHAFTFLASLLNGGEAAAENGWRDYKEAGFLDKTGNADREKEGVKATWSENLSSFANTGGGVLIWGFHTKGKIPDKLSLAPDCGQLADLLRSLTNDATDPYVAGVEIEAIKAAKDSNAGFVVCYIPASTFAPHQAQWGERTYFIRAQDSNLPCPQTLLRSMFYPRAQSRLEPIIKMTASEMAGGSIQIQLQVNFVNLGPATAEVVIISIEPLNPLKTDEMYGDSWLKIGGDFVRYNSSLPPNFSPPQQIYIRGVLVGSPSVHFKFFAHNTPAHHSTVSFSNEEALKCFRDKGIIEKRGRSDPIAISS